jgi:plastocyanin
MKVPAIAFAALFLLAACGGAAQRAQATNPMKMPMPSTSASVAPAGPAVATNAVAIQNFAFGPQTITVRVGTAVTWTNKDQDAHTIDFQGGAEGGQVSQAMQQGDTYSHTFETLGTIGYICSIHPFMHGTVEVTP